MLSVRQLSRSFSEGGRVHRVLERADLEVRRGETVAVTGRSGSGKSTLLNLISGIDHADGGTVQIDGREVTAMGEPARTLFRRAHIGFVYQFFNLIPTLDVEENVRLVLELNGVRCARARARSTTVVIVTHDLALSRAADRVLELREGRLHERREPAVSAPR